jgi:hypothetical protein
MRLALVSLTVFVALLASALQAAPASAWQYDGSSGSPGKVWVPTVYPFEDGRYTTYGPFLMFTTFQSGPYVYRFAWATASDDVGLGSVSAIPGAAGDFRCQNMVRPRQASARWVRLGRTFATGGGW